MVTEIAVVEILEGRELEFEKAIAMAVSTVLSSSNGYMNFTLNRGIERENVYTFFINWQRLEDHTVGFRNSDLFLKWREIIGPFFANPPAIEHWNPIHI
jgi:heme-degrading monooxygenase HmoA